jgi:hypothetical protein
MKNLLRAVVLGVTLFSVSGCYGQFALTKKLYTWNGGATHNKFANSAIMDALIIIPVYPICTLVDVLVLNTIEVFSGSNPMK